MKRLLLIIIILLIGISGWAQDDEFRMPDSLVTKLKEFRKADENRVKALDDCIMFCHEKHHIT